MKISSSMVSPPESAPPRARFSGVFKAPLVLAALCGALLQGSSGLSRSAEAAPAPSGSMASLASGPRSVALPPAAFDGLSPLQQGLLRQLASRPLPGAPAHQDHKGHECARGDDQGAHGSGGAAPTKAPTKARPLSQPAMCFAPGTSPKTIARYERESYEGSLSSEYRLSGSLWSSTATNGSGITRGTPITLTWSIVPDGTPVPARSPNGTDGANSNLQAFLNGIYTNQANWLPIFQQVFDRWSQLTGITYVYTVDDGASMPGYNGATFTGGGTGALNVRGDVRISGRRIDGVSNILAYNYFPTIGDMVIDTADTTYNNTANSSRLLHNVLSHEHGHGLGLNHVCPTNSSKLMEPFLNTNFTGPQLDDVLAVVRGYGDPLEKNAARNNDTPANATSFGTLANGTISRGSFALADTSFTNDDILGIDDATEKDVFSFSTSAAGKRVSVTLTPQGGSYLEGPQNGDGSCTAGTTFNSSSLNNLGFEIVGSNGTTVLTSVNANPAGVAETLSGYFLPNTSGPFYLRVFGSVDDVQLYGLSLTIADPPSGPFLTRTGAISLNDAAGNGNSNGNGRIDPGENQIRLTIPLDNLGGGAATSVSGVISSQTATASVVSGGGTSAYPNIASKSSASNITPFIIAVSSSHPAGDPINLTLTVTSNQGTTPFSFSLPTGSLLTTQFFFDNMESGEGNWTHNGVGADTWAIITDSNAHSPTRSWRALNSATVTDQRLVLRALTIPSGQNQRLRFWHTYAFETDVNGTYDGGVLEISTDGGTTFTDLTSRILSGGYNGTIASGFDNPLTGRSAWVGGNLGAMTEVVVDLSSYAGQSVRLRWREGTDNLISAAGWFVDDVAITTDNFTSDPPFTTSGSGAVISEFRFHGVTSTDEYVEIHNTLSTPLNISGWKLQTNTVTPGTATPNIVTATVPQNTILPPYGHFLFTGSGYTLGTYSNYGNTGAAGTPTTGNPNPTQAVVTLGGDAADDSGAVLLNADNAVQDAVGFASSTASLRENSVLPLAPTSDSTSIKQHAFMRDFVNGKLKDTGNSASDFVLVSTDGAPVTSGATTIPAQLGAPNPESLSSPVNVNSQVAITLLQPEAGLNNAPNRLRTGSGNGGTLLLRRTIRNTGSQPLSRVRLLMTRITSQGSPTGIVPGTQADVRLISSGNESIALPNRDTNGVIIPAGQDGAGTTLTPVYAALLEAPSNATSTSGTPVVTGGGGGLGSSVVFDLTFPTPLLPNTSANYGFNLQVATGGTYLVAFNVLARP